MRSGKKDSEAPKFSGLMVDQISRKIRLWLGGFFFLLSGMAHAQDLLKEQYPFLKTESNRIQFYGDTTRFNSFFDQLNKLLLEGQGQVNVVHLGGSHVQGGMLDHAMRKNFYSLAPGLKGQRGLLFPFALAKTNNPWNYKVEKTGSWEGSRVSVSHHYSEWGVSGITATTFSTSSATTIYSRDPADAFQFTGVRLFYHQCECSFEPIVNGLDITAAVVDSASRYAEWHFDVPSDTLRLTLRKTDSVQSQFILQGIQLLEDGPSIVYNPIGVNGAKTSDYFRSQFFKEQMKLLKPDLVLFGIGINDANTYAKTFDQKSYEANYDQLIAILKEANPDVAILFLTNNDAYFQKSYANPNAYKIREAMINLGKKHNAAVWDLFEIMGGFDSIRLWETYDLASSDKIHFTRAGYELQAQLLFFALRNSFGDYLSARFSKQP